MIANASRSGKRFLNPVPTSIGKASTMLKVLWLYLRNKEERVPKHPLGPFRSDPHVFASPPASGLRITWMGHSTSLVEIDGARILIDPVWDERAAPVQWAGPKRFFPPPLLLSELPRLDAVLLSHDHYDHLGSGTISRLAGSSAAAQAQWIAPLGVGKILKRFGVREVRELDWTESTTVGPVTLTALPARHFSGRSLFNRFESLWASFVMAGPQHHVYYGADSGEWQGFEEIGRAYGPFNLTMLEIGAYHPLWSDIHMGPEGAIRTFRALGDGGLLMPIHWGLFDLALHGWRQPIEYIYSQPDLPLWAPVPGEPTEVIDGQPLRSSWWRQSGAN